MDNFSFNKALNHFNINENDFMEICNKYDYNQITIEQHYAKEKIMPEIEKWLLEDENNSIRIELKTYVSFYHYGSYDEYNEICVSMSDKEICYSPDLTYEWGEPRIELEEHQINFENVSKLIFEDASGKEVKQLIN